MLIRILTAVFILLSNGILLNAQIVINEGSNRNYSTLTDEDQEYPDWIEIYNPMQDSIHLLGYMLSDRFNEPDKWVFPDIHLAPGEYKTIYCSGKNRKPVSPFINVKNTGSFTPVTGWNTHAFDQPYYWDGKSNVIVNICSYNSLGYTTNSVFNQSVLPFYATTMAWQDGSPASCNAPYGFKTYVRPNIKLNDQTIGSGIIQNSPFDYPAPYGNWYWSARTQFVIRAQEMTEAGLGAGDMTSLSFDVVSTDPNTVYDYIDISLKLANDSVMTNDFQANESRLNFHTNFKLAKEGDTVYLFDPAHHLVSSLFVNSINPDNSTGCFPDASSNIAHFSACTPSASNNLSQEFHGQLKAPVILTPSGLYNDMINVHLNNPNITPSKLYYTLDGSDPTTASGMYEGDPVPIYFSGVLKARTFSDTLLPSEISVATYLLGVSHVTPIISVTTDRNNLYGDAGIFDHWDFEWERAAHFEYFDTSHTLLFSQPTGMQVDGGWGGSRANPQHSFRLDFDHSVLGKEAIDYPFIPTKPNHKRYSSIYLRNGSNQYLNYPYKDACAVEGMGNGTYNYYSGYTPVTVYINGNYFGLYELREKFDTDFYNAYDDADEDSMEILSQSAYYYFVLRALEGTTNNFYKAIDSFNLIDAADTAFWDKADRYFDMKYYNDYIIAEAWIGNTDWPNNNIKIYRSNATGYRWRFGIQDFELALEPNAWTNSSFNSIEYLQALDPANPFTSIWLKGIQNERFRKYFINRFADLMNTVYQPEKLIAIENRMFEQTVQEMPKEFARWGDPNNVQGHMDVFLSNHEIYQSELSNRSGPMRDHIQNNLGLAGQVNVTLSVYPEEAGIIQISTIIPDSFPWTGIYFNGNPVRLTAIANSGYDFSYWEPNVILTEPDTHASEEWNITADTEFKAVFASTGSVGKLSFSELNYNSDSTRNSSNWIEIHNYGDGPIDISGWKFTDGNISNRYTLPTGTLLQPDQRIVLAEDTEEFNDQNPGVPVVGPLEFGFSNTSESPALLNLSNQVVLSFTYLDSLPWPEAADGFGPTLELVNDTLNPSLPGSWFAGCIGGSPTEPFSPCNESIIISEINYNCLPSADAGDWLELKNISSGPVDLSGWTFKDGADDHLYSIPAGTILEPADYIVLYSDQTAFESRFPAIANSIGPFEFELKNSGEALRLYDLQDHLYQTVLYDHAIPWPLGADGNGYTLELINENGLMSDGRNWMIGCLEGSPGTPFTTPCITTSTGEINKLLLAYIYPNPSKGEIAIVLEGSSSKEDLITLELFNSLGRLVWRKKDLIANSTYVLPELPDGIYFYTLDCGHHSNKGKLMLVK